MGNSITQSTSSSTLGDILEKILDKGVVIAGDISIAIADVELLTIRIRLIVASVDKAEEMGINWWRGDPNLSNNAKIKKEKKEEQKQIEEQKTKQLEEQNLFLIDKINELEARLKIGNKGGL